MTTPRLYTYREFLTAAESVDANSSVGLMVLVGPLVCRVPLDTTAAEFQGHMEKSEIQGNLEKQAMISQPGDGGQPSVSYNVLDAFMCPSCDELHVAVTPASLMDGLACLAINGPGVPLGALVEEQADVGPGTQERRPAGASTRSMEDLFGKQVDPERFPDIPDDFDLDRVPVEKRGTGA